MRNIASISRKTNYKSIFQSNSRTFNENRYELGNAQTIEENVDQGQESKMTFPALKYKEIRDETLILRSFPIFFWIIGLGCITFSTILLANIIIGYFGDESNLIFRSFYEGYFWQYLVISLIYILGISMFVVAKYEKIYINKTKNLIRFHKLFLLTCKNYSIDMRVSDIESIFLYKTGMSTTTSTSVVFKIGFRFNDERKSIYLFKSVFEGVVIGEIIKLKSFLYGFEETYESVYSSVRTAIISNDKL